MVRLSPCRGSLATNRTQEKGFRTTSTTSPETRPATRANVETAFTDELAVSAIGIDVRRAGWVFATSNRQHHRHERNEREVIA